MIGTEFGLILTNPPKGCRQSKMIVCNEKAKNININEINMEVNETVRSTYFKAHEIMTRYNRQMQNFQWNLSTQVKPQQAMFSLMGISTTLAGAPEFGGITGAALNQFLSKAPDKLSSDLLNSYRIKTEESMNKNLALELKLLGDRAFQDLKNLPKKDRAAALKEGLDSILENPVLDDENVFSNLRDTVHSFKAGILGHVEDSVLDELRDRGDEIFRQTNDIETFKAMTIQSLQEAGHLARELIVYRDSTNASLKKIIDATDVVKGSVNELIQKINETNQEVRNNRLDTEKNAKNIRQNNQRLNFLEKFVYDEMDPKAQIEALKDPNFLKDIDADEREKMQKTAELKEFIASDIGQYVQGASGVLSIIDAVNPLLTNKIEVSNTVRQAISAAPNVIQLGLSLIPPYNLPAAISAVSQLAGMGKQQVDIGAARQEQIMQAFSALFQGQQQILDDLNTVKKFSEYTVEYLQKLDVDQKRIFNELLEVEKNISFMLRLQQQTLEVIDQLDKKIEGQYKSIMRELANLSNQIALGFFNMYSSIAYEATDLFQEKNKLLDAPGYNPTTNCFKDYASLSAFYHGQTKMNLMQGLPKLRNSLYINPFALNEPIFRLNNFEAQASWIPDYLSFYRDFWSVIKGLSPAPEFAFFSGLFPSDNLDQLKRKLDLQNSSLKDFIPQRFYNLFHPESPHGPPIELSDLMQEPYSYTIVTNFVEFAIRFHFLFDVCNENNFELLSLQALSQKAEASEEGSTLLERALLRLEILIVQQTLPGGDCFLPQFFKIWLTGRSDPNYPVLESLFKRNQLLAHNFLIYALHEEVSQRDRNFFRYIMAWNSHGVEKGLKELTRIPWEYSYIPGQGWEVHFAGHIFTLPSPIQLTKANLFQVDGLNNLFKLRSQLLDEIASYQIPDIFTDGNTRKLFMTALYQHQ